MRKTLILLLTVSCAFLGADLAKGSNIVTNPGFETGDLSGWTVSGTDSAPAGNGIYYGVDGADAHSGAYGGYFGPVGGVLDLSQSLATTPGDTYTVSFWLAQAPSAPFPYTNSFAVSLAGTTLFSTSNVSNSGYQQYSYNAVASSGSSNLVFAFRDDTGFFSLDDISVSSNSSGNAAPEPASFFLAIPFLGIVARWRRRA